MQTKAQLSRTRDGRPILALSSGAQGVGTHHPLPIVPDASRRYELQLGGFRFAGTVVARRNLIPNMNDFVPLLCSHWRGNEARGNCSDLRRKDRQE